MAAARLQRSSSYEHAVRSLAAIGAALTLGVLIVAAPGVPLVLLWLACGVLATGIGLLVGSARLDMLVLAILPATVLTGSALVPFEGRYVPAAATMIALVVAARSSIPNGLTRLRSRPWFGAALLAYGAWAVITLASSTDRALSASYVAGLALSLTACALVLPGWSTDARVQRMIAVIAAIGVAIVASGWLLLMLRGVTLFGKDVGVYFVEELTLFGQGTGITFHQNYGPFLGPSTEPLAFATVASLYLATQTKGFRRVAAYSAASIVIFGLVVSFSREGLLMAAIATAALMTYDVWSHRRSLTLLAATGFLTLVAISSLAGVIGVFGRLDLTARWYSPAAVAILMNPDHTERGTVPAVSAPPVSAPGASAEPARSPAGAVPTQPAVYPEVVDLKTASSFDARFSLWSAALAAAAKSPVLGYGLGTDAAAIVPYLVGADARLRGVTTHSTFMRILVEMGVPGLLIQIWLSLVAVAVAARVVFVGRNKAMAVLAGCLAAILFHEFFGTLIFGGFGYSNFLFAALAAILALSDLGANDRVAALSIRSHARSPLSSLPARPS